MKEEEERSQRGDQLPQSTTRGDFTGKAARREADWSLIAYANEREGSGMSTRPRTHVEVSVAVAIGARGEKSRGKRG